MCVYVCVCICMCMCVCVCACVRVRACTYLDMSLEVVIGWKSVNQLQNKLTQLLQSKYKHATNKNSDFSPSQQLLVHIHLHVYGR